MSSSKSKRTITVEKSTSDTSVKAKPSVFDRLGAMHSHGSSEKQDICLDFANNGTCKYGSKCKYAHVAARRERDRGERDRGSDDLRNRVSRKRDENESDPEVKKSLGQRKDKDGKIKSTVVVTKSSDNIEDIWPEQSDGDKGSVERKHESKSRQQMSSSSHGAESESHKSSKLESRMEDKKDEGSSKIRNKSPKSPSHDEDDMSRRKTKDKKKKKRNRSQGSQSPSRLDEKQEQKHQKDLPTSKSAEKHSKGTGESRKGETSSSTTGVSQQDKKTKNKDTKDEKNKSVENRLLMLAMEPEAKMESGRAGKVKSPVKSKRDSSPPPSQGKGKDGRKEYVSPLSKSKEMRKDRVESPSSGKKSAKERSVSPAHSKDVHRDRSVSPSMSKEHKSSYHTKSQNQSTGNLGRGIDKPKPLMEDKSGLDRHEKGPQKMDKGKGGRKRRHSSTSSASSSSSSSSGSESGSSSGSSSSGSSSSSSSSSGMSSDEQRKPTKDRMGKESKHAGRQFDRKSNRPADEKEMSKSADRSKKQKEKMPHDDSRARRQVEEKDRNRDIDSLLGKDTYSRKELSPGRNWKKDWEKGSLSSGQDVSFDSKKGRAPSMDRDKINRDGQYGSRTGESLRQKRSDAAEYSRKTRSPGTKDDRNKPVTPVDVTRRGQSPTESLRSHHSTKPTSLVAENDLEHEREGWSSGQYREYYSSRDKTSSRKDDDRFQPYADELYSKHEDRGDPRSQGYFPQKHSVDAYDRNRDVPDYDREERSSRYNRDHGYEDDRYATTTDRHHAETGDDTHSRQDYYSSSYRDKRRSGKTDDLNIKDMERSDKHSSNYETRTSEREYDARDCEKNRDQRTSDYREKTMRGDGVEHSSSSSKYKKDDGNVDDSRKERPSRRSQREPEREMDDQSRQASGHSGSRSYTDRRDVSRKRPLEDEGGSGRSPCAKKTREGSPSESHHSFNSRTPCDRDSERLEKERDRSQRSRNLGREDDRYSSRGGEVEYRDKGRSERDRGVDKEWDSSRQHGSKDRTKESKVVADSRDRGPDVKESWHREDSSKRRRSPGDNKESWERSKDWKRSRADLEAADREKRRDDDHRGSPIRDRSPKSGSFYKTERTDGDKRASDSMLFSKSLEADDMRGARLKSEEKRDLLPKDLEPSLIPVHMEDSRMRRSQSRGSLGSKHSQRDRESRRDDRHYDDRYDPYRDSHYRDERMPEPERSYDHEDRELWARDRGFERIRPEDDPGRPYRGPFDHDHGERELSKSRDFGENEWELDSFRRDNLGFRGLPRAPNWDRERPREEWDNRFDRGLETEFRPRRDVLLPPPPRPRPQPEARVPSPLPPPVETIVAPPVEHPPVREVKSEHPPISAKATRSGKDDDTGYDDISDGELDDLIGGDVEEDKEENQTRKSGVTDILDIKWESLVETKLQKPSAPSSVLSHFSASAIFRRIGVSREFAGDDLVNQVKTVCQKQLEEEENLDTEEKKELEDQPTDLKIKVKEEVDDSGKCEPVKTVEDQPPLQPLSAKPIPAKFELLDDIADFHAGLQLKLAERIRVVNNIGPYRRALCARRDLAVRRGLCKIEKEDILMFPTHVVDQDLYKQSLQLFHQDRTVEKKLPLNSASALRLPAVQAA